MFLRISVSIFTMYFLLFLTPHMFLNGYEVVFKGIDNPEIQCFLEETSQLIKLKKNEPGTRTALRRRAEADLSNLSKALQSKAYYNAKLDLIIEDKNEPFIVTVVVDIGPQYPFADFKIVPAENTEEEEEPFPYECIHLEKLGISIGTPAYPKIIIEAEDKLLTYMSRKGYPLAYIDKREVLADQTAHSVNVILHVCSGSLARFGMTDVEGNVKVKDEYFYRKIMWKAGKIYDPDQVNRTFNSLESSGLFSSINIDYDEEVDENGLLPIHIHVNEGKHRSIGAGLSYNTDFGIGISGEWQHRNIRGLGERISTTANIWQEKKDASFLFVQPDFLRPLQDLVFQLEFLNEKTKGFVETYYSISETLEKQINDHLRGSCGVMVKELHNTHTDNNGEFSLFKIPMQLMWIKTNSILDPTKGHTLYLKMIPSFQIIDDKFAYVINSVTATYYKPVTSNHKFVLATKLSLGSIYGTPNHAIPPSERLYAGSDNLLRGYKYMTVSPLDREHKPIGGRSLMVFSFEARIRSTETLGFVGFYDIGNVHKEYFPQFGRKQLQSTGIGLRYHTPVGPLRLDLAFPLNRRSHIDNSFQFYVSIGQAF